MADIKSLNGYTLKDAQAREAITSLTTTVTSQGNTVTNLQSTVGQQTTVLAQHGEAITQHGTDITELKTAVGDAASGLTKTVTDNTTAINTLNGTGEGSVAKAIQDAKPGYASDTTAGVVKVGANLSIDGNGVLSASAGSTVVVDAALDNTSTNPVQNRVVTAAITQNTTDISTLNTSVSSIVGDVSDNTTAISTINGSDTGSSMREVAEDVASAIPKAITPKGTVLFANLPTLASSSIGDMYNIEDQFTTTADFIMGAGTQMQANSNVYVIDVGSNAKKWDVFATGGIADMSAYQTKTLTSHTGITATTVEGALEEIASNVDDNATAISTLQTTVGNASSGLVKDVSDNATAISALDTAKQPKTLVTPLTIDGVSQTTVEGALGALNNKTVTVDSTLDTTSTNPVQNAVLTTRINELIALLNTAILSYATVASLPANTNGLIVTGTKAWVEATNQIYSATVSNGAITWTATIYRFTTSADNLKGTANTSEINITSTGA